MAAPCILVTYVTAGAGHRRAAEAIAHALKRAYPRADIACVDVLDDTPRWFRRGYASTYLLLVRRLSLLWKSCYALLDHPIGYYLVQPIRRSWNLFIAQAFVRRVQRTPPDLIIATHFLPADLCSAGTQAGWLRVPFVVMVTDWHPHRLWLYPNAERTVVASQESRAVCEARGLAPSRLAVCGIPIDINFGAAKDRATLQQQFHLPSRRLTVLVTSGGTTVGHFEGVVNALLALEQGYPNIMELLVVCGDDVRIQQRLTQQAQTSAMPMRVFGFVSYMAELMRLSDLIVAKAGGLTISEALALGVPLIFYHVIPGQEQMNAQYVVRHGAALMAPTASTLTHAVERCLNEPGVLDTMQAAAKHLGRPRAAEEIVSRVIAPLLRPQSAVDSKTRP